MKVSKELIHYYKERDRNICLLLKKLRHSFVPENFHQLRVEIKKTKALCKLISFYSKKFDEDRFFKPYRIIFKEAGKVRELQLEEEILKRNKNPHFLKNYRTYLKELRLKEQLTFCKKINTGIEKDIKKSGKIIRPVLKKIKKNTLCEYINKNWVKAQKLICLERVKTNEIHKLRKRLKSLNYLIHISDMKDLKKELEGMKGLMDIIGKWHDCLIMGEHLQKVMRNDKITAGESKTLASLKTGLKEERKFLFQKINKELKAHCMS
jgi:CHAD domain-containing protein